MCLGKGFSHRFLFIITALQLTEPECLLLKAKRKKMMDMVLSLTEREQALNKRSKTLTNEVLAEKISVEKLRIEGQTDDYYRQLRYFTATKLSYLCSIQMLRKCRLYASSKAPG